jgi:tRNA A-37 threonylcarbamoyl transferase component Bud32
MKPVEQGLISQEFEEIKGLSQEEQILLLKKFLNDNSLNFTRDVTNNANIIYKGYHYKYILPHVEEYYKKMEQNINDLLNEYHPKYKFFKVGEHFIMQSEIFGASLNNKNQNIKLQANPKIKKIMKEFLDRGFYHGDLLTSKINYGNVLESNGKIKLIDFGLLSIAKDASKKKSILIAESEARQLQIERKKNMVSEPLVPPTPRYKFSYKPQRRNFNLGRPMIFDDSPEQRLRQPQFGDSPKRKKMESRSPNFRTTSPLRELGNINLGSSKKRVKFSEGVIKIKVPNLFK